MPPDYSRAGDYSRSRLTTNDNLRYHSIAPCSQTASQELLSPPSAVSCDSHEPVIIVAGCNCLRRKRARWYPHRIAGRVAVMGRLSERGVVGPELDGYHGENSGVWPPKPSGCTVARAFTSAQGASNTRRSPTRHRSAHMGNNVVAVEGVPCVALSSS